MVRSSGRSILRPLIAPALAIALAGCASQVAPGATTPLSPDQVAVISAIVTTAQTAGMLAISRTKSPGEIRIIQAAQAALASAWQTYQAQAAARESVSSATVMAAAAGVMAAVVEMEGAGVPSSGASSLPLPPALPSSQSP